MLMVMLAITACGDKEDKKDSEIELTEDVVTVETPAFHEEVSYSDVLFGVGAFRDLNQKAWEKRVLNADLEPKTDEITVADTTEDASLEETEDGSEQEAESEETSPEGEAEVTKQTGNHIVAIDPGHQSKGNNEQEPIGPGASQTKAKVAGGTRGVVSGVPEYQLTLDVSLKLRDELVSRGYKVVMIRESNDVNISNSERAKIAADAGAEAFLRIHADGSDNQSAEGMMVLCPTANNPYCSNIYSSSRKLSDAILRNTVAATGAKSRGVSEVDNMSGINWSTVPVTIVEMGFMTNPNEDRLMQSADYQSKLVKGMADGIDSYFSEN